MSTPGRGSREAEEGSGEERRGGARRVGCGGRKREAGDGSGRGHGLTDRAGEGGALRGRPRSWAREEGRIPGPSRRWGAPGLLGRARSGPGGRVGESEASSAIGVASRAGEKGRRKPGPGRGGGRRGAGGPAGSEWSRVWIRVEDEGPEASRRGGRRRAGRKNPGAGRVRPGPKITRLSGSATSEKEVNPTNRQ